MYVGTAAAHVSALAVDSHGAAEVHVGLLPRSSTKAVDAEVIFFGILILSTLLE